jgi:hypothetical protein
MNLNTTIRYPDEALQLAAAVRRYNEATPPARHVLGFLFDDENPCYPVELRLASGGTARLVGLQTALEHLRVWADPATTLPTADNCPDCLGLMAVQTVEVVELDDTITYEQERYCPTCDAEMALAVDSILPTGPIELVIHAGLEG